MSGAHALLAPSSAARWVACAGSVLLEALYLDEETEEARAGTASHWAAFEILYGRLVALGQVAPNGVVLSDEMIEAAELYVETIDETLARYGLTREVLHVEERVYCTFIHPDNWGTPDCWFYSPTHGVLVVFDYKYGHRFVDEFENWQLIDYTSGVMSALNIDGLADQTLKVELTIVQPRCYQSGDPVRTWATVASNLRPHINILRNAAEAALQPGAKCTPNPECIDCKGRHACQALQQDAYRSVQISKASLPVEMPPAALGLELHIMRQAADRLKARITGLEQQAEAYIREGHQVPFSAMAPTQGRVEWTKPLAEILALGEMCKVNLAKPVAITPTQAIAAGVSKEIVELYSGRKSGFALKPDDGKQARRVFGK